MFDHIVHCDWSKHGKGRWMAQARRRAAGGWTVSGPEPVPTPSILLAKLFAMRARGSTLAAFDFPIGLPAWLGRQTRLGGFGEALAAFGTGEWSEFLEPAAVPAEIGPRRPFYPAKPGAARVAHLLAGLGVERMDDLMRACERGGGGLTGAGCMFWLVGAKTVGKAAIHGWQEVVRPALAGGARLWPFCGDLDGLARQGGLAIAESYPADACRQLGLRVRKKGDPAALKALGPDIRAWTEARDIMTSDIFREAVDSGFAGFRTNCGDAFDAVAGLLAAIAVADGERSACPVITDDVRRWEGWILGRQGGPDDPLLKP